MMAFSRGVVIIPCLASLVATLHVPSSGNKALQSQELEQHDETPHVLVVDHVPKCGGTFVAFMANASVDPTNLQLVHESAQLQPQDVGPGRMVVGMIRNPFDYYISIWAYLGYFKRLTLMEFEEMKPLGDPAGSDPLDTERFGKFLRYFSDKDLGLLSFLVYYSYLDFDGIIPQTSYDYKGTILDAFGNTTEGLAKKQLVIQAMKNFSLATCPVDCWVHTEDATENTRKCFQDFAAAGGKVNFTAFDLGLEVQYTNAKEHLGCSEVYNDELLDFVRSSDAAIFREFNYPLHCTS